MGVAWRQKYSILKEKEIVENKTYTAGSRLYVGFISKYTPHQHPINTAANPFSYIKLEYSKKLYSVLLIFNLSTSIILFA